MEYATMSTYREDVAELISTQIEKALEKEYDRGWDECMKYYWSKRHIRELDDAMKEERRQDYDRYDKDEEKDPYAG
jgi:uncharacterized protein with PIN domain